MHFSDVRIVLKYGLRQTIQDPDEALVSAPEKDRWHLRKI